MNRIRVLLMKEWLELRRERTLLASVLLPPLFLTLMPMGIVYMMGRVPDEDTAKLGAVLANPALAGMNVLEQGQAVMGIQFGTLFLMMPLIIPSVISAYSIVGEKTRRTLEPVLATPIKTWELLLGKALTALLPSMVITWFCALIFVAGMALIALSPRVFAAIVSPAWILVLLLITPLIGLIAIAVTIMVSSRVNDPRTAQGVAGVAIVPIMLIFFGQMLGIVVLSPLLVLGATLVLALLSAALVAAAVRLFEREAILTRWT